MLINGMLHAGSEYRPIEAFELMFPDVGRSTEYKVTPKPILITQIKSMAPRIPSVCLCIVVAFTILLCVGFKRFVIIYRKPL